MSGDLMTIPLSRLQISAENIRKTEAATNLEELAASIASLGLLQNLSVRPIDGANTKRRDSFEVVAGGRRLAALHLLAERKQIAKNYPVLCRLLADAGATEVSLAENIVRVPLHPADQYEAFSKLRTQGLGIEDIAARFGISSQVVAQRLKLAAVSPRLMEEYRHGAMTLDQLIAFTLTDDHTAQEHVWFDGGPYSRDAQSIRRMLTRMLVEGSDRRATFIGAEAYEAAGGTIIRDLFQVNEGYFADSQLLDRLVVDKLTLASENIRREGWAWVETNLEIDYGYLAHFRCLQPTEISLPVEDEARIGVLSTRYDELVSEMEEDSVPELELELDLVTTELEELAKRKEFWSDEQKASSGVILSLDHEGTLKISRGLVREVPAPAVRENETRAAVANDDGEEVTQASPASVLADSLLEDLSAHRTAALRESVAKRPDVALTALLHTLVTRVFFASLRDSAIGVRPILIDLKPSAKGIGESRAAAAMAARHQSWLERMADPDRLWDWLTGLENDARLELLAYCTAVSINAVRRRHDHGVRDRLDQADLLASAVGLDMADWWESTKERYLSRVPKALILAAVTEAVSKQAAENIAAMKKEAMVARAEELLAGRRWLPEPLRTNLPELSQVSEA